MDASKVINTPSPTHGLQLHSCSITTQAVFPSQGLSTLLAYPSLVRPVPQQTAATAVVALHNSRYALKFLLWAVHWTQPLHQR